VGYKRIKTERAAAKQGAKRQRLRTDETEAALSTEQDDRWATANAREALREERWESVAKSSERTRQDSNL